MERIQNALDKARQRRSGQSPTQVGAASKGRPPLKSSEPSEVDTLWEALPLFRPEPKLLERNRIFPGDHRGMANHVDLLRTRALLTMRDNGWTRLAVTSPNISCGKTTTCLNLAYSLSRQKEQRVLLVEMDLRKPNMLKTLGLQAKSLQFSRVLDGREPPEKHLVRLAPNIAMAANKGPANRSSELLQSPDTSRVLDALEQAYQPTITIFDMPPILVSDDVMGFIDNVDCVLLMAAASSTSIKDIDICEKDLAARTNVLGVVLNKCRYMGLSHGYEYYE